MVRLLVLLIRW
ncbi:hypothetical protein CFC21_058258 [Triticum aestivum]|uniref:Uncharacterized protein n=1 Tax=Triticum aestivum TaxID=4565 RepID=A0A9R1GLT6_WHEAT|nr:hypothetical protein CFC21_058258 [Triticum aestivum]